jgi:uncharacterized Zn-binding protein involved in type VI secretion
MEKGYFIGLHDKTTCGGKVLDGDTRVMMFGVAHACEGDRVTCGKDSKTYRIVGGISHKTSHGRAMAGTLDSRSNCPCKAQLIPSVFTASYKNEPSPVRSATRAAVQPAIHSDRAETTKFNPADPNLAGKAPSPLGDLGATGGCDHPDQMEELAAFIAGEMNRNIQYPAVLQMKELISYDSSAAARKFLELPWYARLAGPPNFNAIALAKKLEAMAIWTKQVGQNMEWDHKPKLRELFPGVRHKQGKYLYYYDIWSNIHYGYVGIIGGLSESLLLDGAGAEQIASDTLRKVEELRTTPKKDRELPGPRPTASPWTQLRSWDDVVDRVSISIGIKLANQHPNGGITAQMIMNKVLAVAPENWGDGVSVHVCK